MTTRHRPPGEPGDVDGRNWTLHPGVHWRDVMKEAGVTQASVANAIGCTQKHISQVVTGKQLPSAALTVAFSRHMKVSVRLMWQLRADYELAVALGKKDLTAEFLEGLDA